METTIYDVEIELVSDLLGSQPKDKEIYKNFIASKALSEADAKEEVETVEQAEEKGWTGFAKDKDGYFLYAYTIKGFLCESARRMKTFGAMKQLQDKFKGYAFVSSSPWKARWSRKIRLGEIKEAPLERPLRCQTAQGPRVALVRSDVIPEGDIIKFCVEIYDVSGITMQLLCEVLEYGSNLGLGQWRTGGWGSFKVNKIEELSAKKTKKRQGMDD